MGNDDAVWFTANEMTDVGSPPDRARRRLAQWVAYITSHASGKKHMTQTQVAEALGVKQPTLSRWLSGEIAFPFALVDRLSDLIGVPPEAFVARREHRGFSGTIPNTPPHPQVSVEEAAPNTHTMSSPPDIARSVTLSGSVVSSLSTDARTRLLHLVASLSSQEAEQLMTPLRRLIVAASHARERETEEDS